MDRVDFHTTVLGSNASDRLRDAMDAEGTFVTFRSKPPLARRVMVYIDDDPIGEANVRVSPNRVCLGSALNPTTALEGGFDTVKEQEAALKRAGFRFKPLDRYYAYMVSLSFDKNRQMPPQPPPQQTPPPPISHPPVPLMTPGQPLPPVEEGQSPAKELSVVRGKKKERVVIIRTPTLTNEQLEQLRRRIANRIILPGRPVETRIWQLRIATKIVNFIKPYLRIEALSIHNTKPMKGVNNGQDEAGYNYRGI